MPETPVSRVYRRLSEEWENVLKDEQWETLHAALAEVWSQTQRETREEIAKELEHLAEARMEYVGGEPKDSGAIQRLPGLQQTVYGEASGARHLARIVRGEPGADLGWLPSWRWDDDWRGNLRRQQARRG